MRWSLMEASSEAETIADTGKHVVILTPLDWIEFGKGVSKELGCYCIMNKEYCTVESTANQLAVMLQACLTLEVNLADVLSKLPSKERTNEGVVVQLR